MAGIRVVSKRTTGVTPRAGELVVGIDRPSGSVLGNAFHMTRESQRAEVITNFRESLIDDWHAHGPMSAELQRIAELVRNGQDVALACWCAPRPCHGDVIKRAIEGILAK